METILEHPLMQGAEVDVNTYDIRQGENYAHIPLEDRKQVLSDTYQGDDFRTIQPVLGAKEKLQQRKEQ